MGQNKIPQRLRVAQPGAVPDHQPGMGAQNSDMIGRGFGIRRADPNIDQRDPRAIRPFQVIGRHLRQLQRLFQRRVRGRDLDIPGRDKTGIAAVRISQLFARVILEFRNVELVVGEQNVVLEMAGVGGRVM